MERRITRSKRSGIEFHKKPSVHNEIREWTNKEKVLLLNALRKYGYLNMTKLAQAVPTKSPEQIRMFLAVWFKTARSSLSHGNINLVMREAVKAPLMEGGNLNTNEDCPLDQWLKKLEAAQPTSAYNEAKCLPIAKSFLFISKFEKHPAPEDCGGVDFKALYEYLYCMLSGYPAKRLNPASARLLYDSFQELAASIKEKGMSKETEFLEKVSRCNYNRAGKVFQYPGKRFPPKSTDVPDKAETCMRNLLELQGFNPLNVPLELLKQPK